ncbi:MAG: hypothetical protein K0M40_03840 [Prolixibacteraceae bacterium]|nr:hypothetical protein [Prolixibacteraceae bacterium]
MENYYKGVVKSYLKQHHKKFYKEIKADGSLDEVLTRRVKHFLDQMERSSNPQDEKEIAYQEMLTF